MPTVLPTPASTPDFQKPDLRAKDTGPAPEPKPAFSQALSTKRGDLDDDAVAEPAVVQTSAVPDTAPAGVTDGPSGPPAEQPRDTASPTDAAAHGERGIAQVLPTFVPSAVPVGTPPSPESPSTGSPSAAVEPSPTPPVSFEPAPDGSQAVGAQSRGSTSAPASVTPPIPIEGAPSNGGLQPLVPQAVQGRPVPDPLTPLEPQTTPGPIRVGGEPQPQQQQSPETGAESRSGNGEGRQQTHHPAVGRAMHVQAAVTVENVTGQLPPPPLAGPQPAVAGAGHAPAPTLAELNADNGQAMGRLVRGLTAMLHQRGGSMTMKLDPPALGQLRVQMTIARGAVTAEFQPGTAEAQAVLDRSIATLRSALESQGLTVERLTVHAPPGSSSARETAEDQSQQQQQQSTRHQSDAGDGRSRGRGDNQQRQGTPDSHVAANFAEAMALGAAAENHSDETGAEAA